MSVNTEDADREAREVIRAKLTETSPKLIDALIDIALNGEREANRVKAVDQLLHLIDLHGALKSTATEELCPLTPDDIKAFNEAFATLQAVSGTKESEDSGEE